MYFVTKEYQNNNALKFIVDAQNFTLVESFVFPKQNIK